MRHNLAHKQYLGIILFAVVICVIYSYRLNFPPEPYYDEVHYVRFLKKLIHEHTYDYVSPHPPLWHLMTLAAIGILGEQPVAWRIVSLLSGLLLIPFLYLLTKKITHDTPTAICAAMLFALDCISFTQARIGMFNSLSLLWMMLALWAFLHLQPERPWPRRRVLLSTGFFLGLGVATKLATLGMAMIIYFLAIFEAIKRRGERKELILESILFLVILPLIIYFCAHAFIPFLPGYSWKSIWEIQKFNFHYHLVEAATQTHQYASQWWGWPLLLRPVWYYYAPEASVVRGIVCIGNPAIFWVIPSMVAYLFWDLLRRKSKTVALILLGFLGQWLFYAIGARLKFFHYFYFAMPFVAMGLAWICRQLWKQGRVARILVCAYLVLVLGMFIYWYPLLAGIPIPEKYFQHHMWFRSWI
jgi:dolichyl-phosphate-mannose--protein O-mannosyl transferase